jgi:hypothetical protein
MISNRVKTTFLAPLVLATLQMFSADGPFYTGKVVIETIDAHISIDDNATVIVEYTLVNEGDKEESIDLAFQQFPVQLWIGDEAVQNGVSFNPTEKKIITLAYVTDVEGETTKAFSFNPALTFNGQVNSTRVKTTLVEILLPYGIHHLIGSNKEWTYEEVGLNNRVSYRWAYNDVYPTTLTVQWSTLDIDLSVQKNASPQKITEPNQILNIEILVQNKGDLAVNNIVISDDYVPYEFEAYEPLEEFSLQESTQSDPRLYWVKQIEVLQPGESRSLNYSVRYVGDVSQIFDFDLRPCIVLVEGNLIGVSNTLTLSKMVGAEAAGEEGATEPSVTPKHLDPLFFGIIAIAVVIGVGLIVTGIILTKRRR